MQTILASALPTGVSTLRPAPAAVVQAGAICYRRARATDGYDVLLISGRSTGRWGIPKGHLEAGETTKAQLPVKHSKRRVWLGLQLNIQWVGLRIPKTMMLWSTGFACT